MDQLLTLVVFMIPKINNCLEEVGTPFYPLNENERTIPLQQRA